MLENKQTSPEVKSLAPLTVEKETSFQFEEENEKQAAAGQEDIFFQSLPKEKSLD